MKLSLILIAFLILFSCTRQSQDIDAHADRLGRKIRCPVCRGVSVAESPSEMAKQMMAQIKRELQAGKRDDEILNYFEDRYGEWIRLEPKPSGINLFVWILPLLFTIGGAVTIVVWAKRAHQK